MDAPLRSLLYTPGHLAPLVAKVLAGRLPVTPDVAILDLEDGVPPAEKDSARRVVSDALGVHDALGGGDARCLRFVRIDRSGGTLRADLRSVVRPGLDGVVVPKVARAEDLATIDEMLLERERDAKIPERSVKVIASIETAAGLIDAPRIAGAPRLVALMFGSEDFAADLGLPARRVGEAADLLYARSAIVVAAAAAGIPAIDGIWADFRDAAGLREDALRGRRLGFSWRQCIHPDQVAVVNEVFSPTAAEIEHAKRVVTAFDDGLTRGLGAVALDGEMLDAPIVARARRVLRKS